MADRPSYGGKRELLASGLYWSGAAFLLSQLPARDQLVVLNYHRIGNAEEDLFDPGVFSATADQFNEQIGYLKRRNLLVSLAEAQAFIDGTNRDKTSRCRVLITFDDGYLDNYQIAFPILRSHGTQGVFFLATSMVGSCHIAWWDRIAYLVKTGQQSQFTLNYPTRLAVDLEKNGVADSLKQILKLYKLPENTEPARFMQELAEASQGEEPSESTRRFLDWQEACAMIQGGMAIGSHTHSHTILSQLSPEQQLPELSNSRAILQEKLGISIDTLAYPVGAKTSYTDQTQKLAEQAGYRAAFSFHGGTNLPGATARFDVQRIGIGDQSSTRFRVQTEVCRRTATYWP
jgi:peptidoglycan/xylan/chitin deacetylase (PgdA/CDA1 family)